MKTVIESRMHTQSGALPRYTVLLSICFESRRILEIEINSSTDNPLIFTEGDNTEVISGGNFHGQYIALSSDSISIACHELASISERRINQI